ncbi:MAG TPA: hypothetical protein VNV17_01800 [Solirubrobacteraceae bacterium]|nr:hypothetical protein [Solirubrobacteraceae bacterium]
MISGRLVCALAVAASLAVAGCGSGKSSSSISQVDFKTGFAANHKAFGVLVTEIAKDLTGAASRTDAQLAAEFGGLATRADQEASQLADLTAPSKYSKRMGTLVTGFHALKADLSTISTAATKHNAQSAETATRALLTDAAKIKTADTSLSKDLGLLKAQSKSQS